MREPVALISRSTDGRDPTSSENAVAVIRELARSRAAGPKKSLAVPGNGSSAPLRLITAAGLIDPSRHMRIATAAPAECPTTTTGRT